MLKKIISSVMCGIYISLGATAFIALDNIIAGALFFTAGILMVSVFFNMLVTRVIALYAYKEYKTIDIITALLGNTAGCIIYAALLSLTRFTSDINTERTEKIVGLRLGDNYISLFILAVFCGFMVAGACLAARSFPELPRNRGAAMFLTALFVALFVVCGFEHIAADAFFFAFYAFNIGFKIEMLPVFFIIAAGNIIGGIGTGYLNLYREKGK